MDEIVTAAEELAAFTTYQEYKAAFDAEVSRTELAFVRIGYMLRLAEDTDILKESGYANMEEFAAAEYRIDKSQASRFININKRFSEGGYSGRLQKRFEGYGVAKLGELLALPDEVIESLPPELTRTELQEVKREIREEQKVTDLEVLMEGTDGQESSLLEKWMDVYFRENPQEFLPIKNMYLEHDQTEGALNVLAPSGSAAKMARVQGVGKLMLAVKGKDNPIILLNVRNNEKEEYSWEDCIRILKGICPYTVTPKQVYEARYQIPFPEPEPPKPMVPPEQDRKPETKRPTESARKGQVAPVQQDAQKKAVKPEDAHPVIPAPEQQTGTEPIKEPIKEPEQMELDKYPGVVPESHTMLQTGEEAAEKRENPRDEGARLAEEVAQWMKTGTMEYAQQVERMILRLQGIIEQLMDEEHH